jgi:hypothetical protein
MLGWKLRWWASERDILREFTFSIIEPVSQYDSCAMFGQVKVPQKSFIKHSIRIGGRKEFVQNTPFVFFFFLIGRDY